MANKVSYCILLNPSNIKLRSYKFIDPCIPYVCVGGGVSFKDEYRWAFVKY